MILHREPSFVCSYRHLKNEMKWVCVIIPGETQTAIKSYPFDPQAPE